MDLKDLVLQTLDEVAQDSGVDGENGRDDMLQKSADLSERNNNNTGHRGLAGTNGDRSGERGKDQGRDQDKRESNRDGSAHAESPNPKSAKSAQQAALEPAHSKPKLPKTSIESSPTKTGKVIPPAQARASMGQEHEAFLQDLREKLLVLFEGLKMPELQDTQNKLDLVIRFLQYELCVIDEILTTSNSPTDTP